MLLLAISSSHLHASLSLRPAGLQFRSEIWSALQGSTVRGGADVLKGSVRRIDVLVEVTSVLLVRHRVAKFVVANLWHGRDFTIWISQNTGKNGNKIRRSSCERNDNHD